MATVVDREVNSRIESALERALGAWKEVPSVAREWAAWDDESRLHFEVDWAVQEDLLIQLKQWHHENRLSVEQQKRYERLTDLVCRSRPTLDRLFESHKETTS